MVNVIILENLDQRTLDEDTRQKITAVAQTAFRLCDITAGEVTILFVEAEEGALLNRNYRGKEGPTDVLSFPVDPAEVTFLDPEERPLGDIVICYPRALEQAQEYGHSILRELCFLTVHGCLHLAGYDHQDEMERRRMRAMEETVLKELGLERRWDADEEIPAP
ncbi:MAG TPA: rRNA maturation RNase YbeY [Firmicutes bacterium]|jgi:probable rRNA maturation factor|nr:rRNA maturation RNase YbeY [Bacillota bacterium]